ncbi:MAG TPA: glycosyltransferase [Acidimicrobiales bacterium]|nr:glycosyltransferase [Acidimicrobiales bacterium]
MKVLHLTSSFPRWEGDHQAPYLAELVAAQTRAGISPSVLAPHAPGLPEDDVIGAPVHRFRYAPEGLQVLAYQGGLMRTATTPVGAAALPGFLAAFAAAAGRAARRQRVDLVHAHWWLPAGAAGVVAARAAGVPLVVTCHGSDVHLAGRPRLRPVARAVLRRAALVAAVSDALASEVAGVTGGAVEVLRMPVVPDPAPPAALPPHPPLRLFACGRLMPEKGFDVAISAVNRLAADGFAVRLVLMGDGPLEAPLRALASASGAVELVGAGGRPDLVRRIDEAHALVVPSRREGLGLIAVDALARGRPVVASAVGGLVETVGDDGVLVPPDDPDALAAALRRLPLPAVTAAAAVAAHDPAAVAEAHAAAYRRVLGR